MVTVPFNSESHKNQLTWHGSCYIINVGREGQNLDADKGC
jgi:hypothetical protein